MAVIAPRHKPGGAIRSDVVVVAHVAEGDDRILLRVGLHDREGLRAELHLACRLRAGHGRGQAQVFPIGLDQVDGGAGHPLIPHGMEPAAIGRDPGLEAIVHRQQVGAGADRLWRAPCLVAVPREAQENPGGVAVVPTHAAGTVVPDGVEDAVLVDGRTGHLKVAGVVPRLRLDDLAQVLRVVAGLCWLLGSSVRKIGVFRMN